MALKENERARPKAEFGMGQHGIPLAQYTLLPHPASLTLDFGFTIEYQLKIFAGFYFIQKWQPDVTTVRVKGMPPNQSCGFVIASIIQYVQHVQIMSVATFRGGYDEEWEGLLVSTYHMYMTVEFSQQIQSHTQKAHCMEEYPASGLI